MNDGFLKQNLQSYYFDSVMVLEQVIFFLALKGTLHLNFLIFKNIGKFLESMKYSSWNTFLN